MSDTDTDGEGIPPWREILSHDIDILETDRCRRCGRLVRDIMADGGACKPPSDEIRDIQPGDGYGRHAN